MGVCVSDQMSVPHLFVLACLASLAGGSVLPAYSIYEDALAHIEMMSTDEIIDILTDMVDKRLREEAYEEAADAYIKQDGQERGGDKSETIDKS